jgi:hypothetical protein
MKALRGVVKSAIDAEAAGVNVLLYCGSNRGFKEKLDNMFIIMMILNVAHDYFLSKCIKLICVE